MEDNNPKVDRRTLCSPQRVELMRKMREAKAAKAAEKKKGLQPDEKKDPKVDQEKKVEEKVEPQLEEEPVEEIEIPVVKKKQPVKMSMESPNFISEDIRRYVESCLPEEFRSQARKQKKWETRKQEIKNEILLALQENTTSSPQPSKVPQKTVAKNALNLNDFFNTPIV